MENTRKNKRFLVEVPLDDAKLNIKSVDIHSGGIGIVTDQELAKDKEMVFALDLDPSESPVFVTGVVRWVESIPGSTHYRAGLSFNKDQEDNQRLKEYFES